MKVQILRSEREDDKSKTGVGMYADLIEDLLKETGNEVEAIPFEIRIDKGIREAVKAGVTGPLRSILSGRKDTDVVHAVFEYCSVYLPLTKAKRAVTFHHVVGKDEKNSKKWFITWRFSAWMSVVFADKIMAVSSQTRDEILSRYRVPPERIEVITHVPKGMEVRDDVPKEKIIGCMGTINERKNFSAAVRVFGSILEDTELSGYRMVICGKGPMKEKLLEQIRSMGIEDKVTFIQDVSKEELVRFYNRCSMFLNTSSHEGLGMVTVEAQMCGTPVLYFKDAKIPPEVMEAAVPCKDEEDMAERAKAILKDGDSMIELINEGLEFTKRLGSDFREKTMKVYESLCEK